jgi:uncharacterized glyoxalase superfamily protein PhnB
MSEATETAIANVFPAMRYNDAHAAIDWLERAFGFERHLVVSDDKGGIAHAELRLGPGIIMLSSAKDDEFRMQSPRDLGHTSVCLCIYVADVDGHYERAVAAGAEIVRPLADTHYGSREFGARDPEGQLWFFGNYHPLRT